VHRWGEPRSGSRLARFHEALEERSMVRVWRSAPEHWEYAPLDELPAVARAVAERLGLPPPHAGGLSGAS
jgi:mitochondrial fission protein ELM1